MKKAKLLIVDDKPVNIRILSSFLVKRDFEIQTAQSGSEALEVIKYYTPELVLMDICMPGMDGIECAEKLKEQIDEDIFIIFVTALKDSQTERRVSEVGAAGFFNKPVDLNLLVKNINRCLGINTGDTEKQVDKPFGVQDLEATIMDSGPSVHNTEKEKTLLHFSKLKDIGQLSSSIAHDINNYLGGILGNVSLIELSTDDEEILTCCSEIKKAVNSTSELSEALTSYSKKEPCVRKRVDISEALNDALNLIDRDARYFASVKKEIDEENIFIDGIYSELTNIFLNILKNAYQAVEKDGLISISLKRIKLHKTKKLLRGTLKPGEYVQTLIEDNGRGISPEVLEHIFEPFFTTKEDGTGLGLSSALKYLQANGGVLDIASASGVGTSVYLYFLISEKKESKSAIELKEKDFLLNLEGMRFVIMDDDIIFCSSLSAFLKKHKASVVSFTDDRFNTFLEANPSLDDYDVLFVDYQSPFFNSIELIERLTNENKSLQSYIISGSKVDTQDIERCGSFRKPLNFNKLAQKVIKDIDGK